MIKPVGKVLVAVTWRDPHGTGKTSCFYEHELPHSCVMITTYGWLMRKDEKGVSLVGEMIGDASMRDYTFVPTELIDAIEEIPIRSHTPRTRGPKATVQAPK